MTAPRSRLRGLTNKGLKSKKGVKGGKKVHKFTRHKCISKKGVLQGKRINLTCKGAVKYISLSCLVG